MDQDRQNLNYQINANPNQMVYDIDSDDSDDEVFIQNIKKKVEYEMQEEDENEGEIPRTKNEKVVQPVLNPESREEREKRLQFFSEKVTELSDVGYVESVTKDSIVMYRGVNTNVLNLDQIILTADKEIVGVIEDVFGRIEAPHYRIIKDAYNQQLIDGGKLKIGDHVYIDKNDHRFLTAEQIKSLMMKKGCDASNQFDEEIDENEAEPSDDESESQRKQKKNKNKNKDKEKGKEKEKEKERRKEGNFYQPPPFHNLQPPPVNQPSLFQQHQTVFQQQLQQAPLVQQFMQIGQQQFSLLPGGIPNLLQPRNPNK